MMVYDLVVRNGTLIDGSGAPRQIADVGIADGRIVTIGKIDDQGREEIDAEGHIVAPGFVDAHTHMDAQVFWDELGSTSCFHGVTTAVMGNCGFTLAPAPPEHRALVVSNIERAEDISAEALAQGIDWTWSTFAEYLDAVDARPKGINYACSVGHSPLRVWAMGERAFTDAATPAEIAIMASELRSALAAGAAGFSTSRQSTHVTMDDRPVASRQASWDEVVALVEVMAKAGHGGFQLAPETHHRDPAGMADYEHRLRKLALATGITVSYGVIGGKTTEFIDETAALGGHIYGLTHCRGVSEVQSFRTSLRFDVLPEWKEVRSRPLEEQRRLLQDPEVCARLVHAAHHGDYGDERGDSSKPNFGELRVIRSAYLPNPTVTDLAKERGVDPVELMIGLALEENFDVFFQQFFGLENDENMIALLRNPNTAMTFSDSGAHVRSIIDSSIQSHLLAYWVRERGLLTLEEAIEMVTSRPAKIWKLSDRGLLREGYAADITIFDPATVAPSLPSVVHDLPGGSGRLFQKAEGYIATIVNGQIFMRDGKPSPARAGRLLRAGNDSAD
jgi:N-acyl-D-aspartate/D-glutamate deacylase